MNPKLSDMTKGIIRLLRGKDAFLVSLLSLCFYCTAQTDSITSSNYDQLVVNASRLLKEGKLDDAEHAAEQAVKANPADYLAYAVEAKIASKQSHTEHAKELIDTALTLAPDADKDKVRELATMINPANASAQTASPTTLSNEDQSKLDVLMLILDDADNATTADVRAKAFREFRQQGLFVNETRLARRPSGRKICLLAIHGCYPFNHAGTLAESSNA
jgi:tetratricopeptide (TPR) repeat protein